MSAHHQLVIAEDYSVVAAAMAASVSSRPASGGRSDSSSVDFVVVNRQGCDVSIMKEELHGASEALDVAAPGAFLPARASAWAMSGFGWWFVQEEEEEEEERWEQVLAWELILVVVVSARVPVEDQVLRPRLAHRRFCTMSEAGGNHCPPRLFTPITADDSDMTESEDCITSSIIFGRRCRRRPLLEDRSANTVSISATWKQWRGGVW